MIDIEKKFKKVISNQEMEKLKDISMFRNPDGVYEIFNSYFIDKKPEGAIVKLHNGDLINSFYNLKNAMCWCIFDKRGRYTSAKRIIELDLKLSSIEVTMTIHQKLFKKTKDTEKRLLYSTKLIEDKIKKQVIMSEMSTYIGRCKTWQYQQFAQNSTK